MSEGTSLFARFIYALGIKIYKQELEKEKIWNVASGCSQVSHERGRRGSFRHIHPKTRSFLPIEIPKCIIYLYEYSEVVYPVLLAPRYMHINRKSRKSQEKSIVSNLVPSSAGAYTGQALSPNKTLSKYGPTIQTMSSVEEPRPGLSLSTLTKVIRHT